MDELIKLDQWEETREINERKLAAVDATCAAGKIKAFGYAHPMRMALMVKINILILAGPSRHRPAVVRDAFKSILAERPEIDIVMQVESAGHQLLAVTAVSEGVDLQRFVTQLADPRETSPGSQFAKFTAGVSSLSLDCMCPECLKK